MTTRARQSLIAAGILAILVALAARQLIEINAEQPAPAGDDDSAEGDDDSAGRFDHLPPAPKEPKP